jgi:hypothetical protein
LPSSRDFFSKSWQFNGFTGFTLFSMGNVVFISVVIGFALLIAGFLVG